MLIYYMGDCFAVRKGSDVKYSSCSTGSRISDRLELIIVCWDDGWMVFFCLPDACIWKTKNTIQPWSGWIITARRSYASAVLGVVILSVRLSVRHTRALWLIQRSCRRCFYTSWKGNPSSFLMRKISAKFQRGHPKQGRQIEVGVG